MSLHQFFNLNNLNNIKMENRNMKIYRDFLLAFLLLSLLIGLIETL